MLAMMGFFAVYAGFLYNDCFSLGLDIFGRTWEWENEDSDDRPDDGNEAYQLSDYGSDDSVYPFGLDPT